MSMEFRKVVAFLLPVVVWAVASTAEATPATYYWFGTWSSPTPSFDTLQAACETKIPAGTTYSGATGYGFRGTVNNIDVYYGACKYKYVGSNTEYTLGGSGNYFYQALWEACQAPLVLNPETRVCEDPAPPPCQAGATGSMRAHTGWVSTWDSGASVWGVNVPTSACDTGGCRASLSFADGACSAIEGLSGTGAPYPVYCWYSYSLTGEQCAASEPTIATPPDPVPCPSGTQMGEVDGRSGCYPTSSTATQSTTNPDGSTTTTKTTENPDGSRTVESTTTNPDGTTTTTRQTVTPPSSESGEVGVSGPGSTAGGSAGGGGSSGGAVGTGGTGDTEQAKFCQDNPKAALCQEKIKIDETGTPTAESAEGLGGVTQQAAEGLEAHRQYIEGDDWKKAEWGWEWASDLPQSAGACVAQEIHDGHALDICQPLGRIREWWAYVFVVLCGLYVWRRGTRDTV